MLYDNSTLFSYIWSTNWSSNNDPYSLAKREVVKFDLHKYSFPKFVYSSVFLIFMNMKLIGYLSNSRRTKETLLLRIPFPENPG